MICKHCGNDEPICFDELDHCNACTYDWYTQQIAEAMLQELEDNEAQLLESSWGDDSLRPEGTHSILVGGPGSLQ